MTHSEFIKMFPGANPDKLLVLVEDKDSPIEGPVRFLCVTIRQAKAGGYEQYVPLLLTDLPK